VWASHLQPRQRRLAERMVLPVTATVAQVMATAVMVAAAHTVTRVTVVLTTVLTVTPVTTAHITGLMDMHLSAAMATAVTVAAAHTVTCQFAITVVAAHTVTRATVVLTMGVTDTPCITAHITGLMDTHHSSRGIAFIDRFMLSRVISPAIAPLATRRTGVDVRCAPHALWLDS